MRTEISAKFRRDGVEAELAAAGLELTDWWTDPAGDFALSLSVPRDAAARRPHRHAVKRVTAVIVAYGDEQLLPAAVEAALASHDVGVEVVIVDNGCTDGGWTWSATSRA